jgi:hypothetical protein
MKANKAIKLFILVVTEQDPREAYVSEILSSSYTKKDEAIEAAKRAAKKGYFASIYQVGSGECVEEFNGISLA